jgi:hypothetical protein
MFDFDALEEAESAMFDFDALDEAENDFWAARGFAHGEDDKREVPESIVAETDAVFDAGRTSVKEIVARIETGTLASQEEKSAHSVSMDSKEERSTNFMSVEEKIQKAVKNAIVRQKQDPCEEKIQKALKNAIVRQRQEAGSQEDACEAEAAYDWQQQQLQDWQEWQWHQGSGPESMWQPPQQDYSWEVSNRGVSMQPAFVSQSDGLHHVGFSWQSQNMSQSNVWHQQSLSPPPPPAWHAPEFIPQSAASPQKNPQYVNWQNPIPENLHKSKPQGSESVMPIDIESVKIEAQVSEARAPIPAPMPVPIHQPSSYDLRSNWRNAAAKRLNENRLKIRKDNGKGSWESKDRYSALEDPNIHTGATDQQAAADGVTDAQVNGGNGTSKQMLDIEELDQIGQKLVSLYAQRCELQEHQSSNSSTSNLVTEETNERAVKFVSWADMSSPSKTSKELESFSPNELVHGGG